MLKSKKGGKKMIEKLRKAMPAINFVLLLIILYMVV